MSSEISYSKSDVTRKVERIVCNCVNRVLYNKVPVYPSTIYKGRTNALLTSRVARAAVFTVLHDRFGISYSDISRHSNISSRNIIRSVRSYKDIPDSDVTVKRLNELIDVKLKRFPI